MNGKKLGFGGIQFNTALKHISDTISRLVSFGGIQFNTALKLHLVNFNFF